MDKTKSEDKIIFRNKQECCSVPDMGSNVLLSVACLHKIPDEIWQFANRANENFLRGGIFKGINN
jgi:hypothetical protein